MTLPRSRTAIATALTAVCVVVPCTAWYLAGSRATRQQASRLEDSPRRQAQQEATRLAQQIALRLEAMRQSESRRPFLDYLSDERFEQLLEGCTYDAKLRSPLTEGPVDPLIWAHFQIDESGLVTLPTVSERFPELGSNADFGLFCSRLAELQNAVVMEVMSSPTGPARNAF